MFMRIRPLHLISLLSFCLLQIAAQGATVFPYGSTWKYFIGTEEASTPTSSWRQSNFVDTVWQDGIAPIGFATTPNDPLGYEATIRTTLPTATASNYVSVFLRKTFFVANPQDLAQVRLNIIVDDGYVVWINGTELGRYNAPAGEPSFNSVPPGSVESTPTLVTNNSPASFLVAGTNVVAIQLFNGAANSSDLFLDVAMSVIETDFIPPTIGSVSPAPGS